MSNLTSWSSMNTMLQTSSIVFQTVRLTDELKIALQYDVEDGLLNVFVRNTGDPRKLPCQINVLSNRHEHCEPTRNDDYQFSSSDLQSDEDEDKIVVDRISWENDQPAICIEISNMYVYDLEEDNEDELCQTVIASSTSCFDDQSTDNDDGYSTHSLDDTEPPTASSLAIPTCKQLVPFFDDSHREQREEDTSSIRRLIAQLMWLSPFKKTVRQMMINHRFG